MSYSTKNLKVSLLATSVVFALAACDGDDGAQGPAGPAGPQGEQGPAGPAGQDAPGAATMTASRALAAPGVQPCLNGFIVTETGEDANGDGVLDASEVTQSLTSCGTTEAPAPISSLEAVYRIGGNDNIPDYVKGLVNTYATSGTAPTGFPLANDLTDSVRTIPGISSNTVIQWFDPLTTDDDGPIFGANIDYTSYFGDDWDSDWTGDVVGSAPQFNGDPQAGFMWINHEYVSDGEPALGSAPTGQNLSNALHGMAEGILNFDVTDDAAWTQERVDQYINLFKQQLGGSWVRLIQRADGQWTFERTAANLRYDATDATQATVTGFTLSEADIDDNGNSLPDGVIAGILADCSGGTSPWGTIVTAEENVQGYYGDLEDAWSSRQAFDPSSSWGPGANVVINYSPVAPGEADFTLSDESLNHNREVYGFLTEIDPGVAPGDFYESTASGGDGAGHRKIGSFGRARWENTTFVTDSDFELVNGQPVVMYGGNDRRSGRIYKWVSEGNYTAGMTKGQVRALLDSGTLYVAHFEDLDTRTGYTLVPANGSACASANVFEDGAEDKAAVFAAGCESPTVSNRGNGRWIELSTTSTDIAPNAGATAELAAGTTVGQALQDTDWNSIGGFPDDNTVLAALFTASMKIGVMELNRPEDLEWNPVDNRVYIAFTSHGRPTALTQDGVMKNSGAGGIGGEEERRDDEGAIFALEEADTANPGSSDTFTFWAAWQGERGNCEFCGENPDNIMIDADGGVWFGTDGNFSDSRLTTDSLYYLDLDPAHQAGQPGVTFATYGRPFRVVSGPSNSEATGPSFNSDMTTIFFGVQHPGEGSAVSTWPNQ